MITAKQIFYSAALVLAGSVLAVIAAYVLVDDESLVAWIAKRAESAAGVSISYQAPAKLTRTLSPTLTVADLSVVDAETRYALNTTSLQLQISLPRLILGRLDIPRLWLGDTRIEVRTANDGIVLSGTVSSSAKLARALELAERYAPAFGGWCAWARSRWQGVWTG